MWLSEIMERSGRYGLKKPARGRFAAELKGTVYVPALHPLGDILLVMRARSPLFDAQQAVIVAVAERLDREASVKAEGIWKKFFQEFAERLALTWLLPQLEDYGACHCSFPLKISQPFFGW